MNEELERKIAEALEQNQALLKSLVGEKEVEKEGEGESVNKDAASSMTAQQLHGVNGLFSTPGLEREVITAHVRPMGIASVLPLIPSVVEDPRFGSITGYTAPNGSRPTTSCADAQTGYVKSCMLTARFGLVRFDTNTIEFDKVMLKANRGDLTDLILKGKIFGLPGLKPSDVTPDNILNIVTKSEMVIAGVGAERMLAKDIWQGTVAAGSGPGLDVQIATGQKDAETSVLCPALDSDIKDFNYSAVNGTDKDIVEYLSMLVYYIEYNAERMGLDPIQLAIVMRPELWFELSSVWPCRYLTNRCSNSSGTNIAVINDNVNVAMRDAMRNNLNIDINGKKYPVILDTGIYERNNTNDANLLPGSYASSIYVVPLTITGGFPVTYREYLDYSQGAGDKALLQGKETFWTDNGAFSWYIENEKWCYKLGLKTEQRIVLRTPQLAGKLQKVKYTPLQHLRDYDPTSPYFADGGVSLRTGTFGSAVWS